MPFNNASLPHLIFIGYNYNKTKQAFLIAFLFVALSCSCENKKGKFARLKENEFISWHDDSIKTFLTDKWVRIGIINKGNIESDTLGIIFRGKENIDTIVIELDGKYFLHKGQKIKQTEIPCINLDFENGEACLLEDDCYPPTFDTCLIAFKSMFKQLEIKQGKFYSNSENQTKEIDIRFLNQFIIVIDKKVYIRKKRWVEFSKTK